MKMHFLIEQKSSVSSSVPSAGVVPVRDVVQPLAPHRQRQLQLPHLLLRRHQLQGGHRRLQQVLRQDLRQRHPGVQPQQRRRHQRLRVRHDEVKNQEVGRRTG